MDEMRFAVLEDVNAISTVMATGWKNAYRGILNDDLLDSIRDDRWVSFLTQALTEKKVFPMVLTEDGRIIGTVMAFRQKESHEVKTSSFYFLPDKIGKGYAHRFITWLENELKNMGFTYWSFTVFQDNERALKFFTSHGFTNTGRLTKDKYGEQFIQSYVFEKYL